MKNQLNQLKHAFHTLSFYQNLLKTGPGQQLYRLVSMMAENRSDRTGEVKAYHKLLNLLYQEAYSSPLPVVGDAWQNFLLNFILADDNPFTRFTCKDPLLKPCSSLHMTIKADLLLLQQLFNATTAVNNANELFQNPDYPNWLELDNNVKVSPFYLPNHQIKQVLFEAKRWDLCVDQLANFYHQKGYGIFAGCIAFKWFNKGLLEIIKPDSIRLKDLIGYNLERQAVVDNTRQFLTGFPANNLLLYGDRGTGKSSTVKALLNEFWEEGLRMVEVTKSQLDDLPILLDILRQQPQRFVIFIDDLSFGDAEREYLSLKAFLEGSLETRPENVIVYATSNRRHLVKEMTMDRTTTSLMVGDTEFRTQDSMQEKLSLADRFGMTVIFTSPDQNTYLEIVNSLACQRGLMVAPDILRHRAIQWALLHNGRSGRTARQFIDYLEGELALEENNKEDY